MWKLLDAYLRDLQLLCEMTEEGISPYCVIMAKYIKSESLEKDVIIDNSISHVAYDDKDCAS